MLFYMKLTEEKVVQVSVLVLGAVRGSGSSGQVRGPLTSGAKINRFFLHFCTSATDCHSLFYYQHGKDNNLAIGSGSGGNGLTIDLPPASQQSQQLANIVFVQPPDIKYKHNIVLNGEQPAGQTTTVYVLPQKDEHSINITDSRLLENELDKPTFIYLKNHPEDKHPQSPMQPQTSFSKVRMRYTVSAN